MGKGTPGAEIGPAAERPIGRSEPRSASTREFVSCELSISRWADCLLRRALGEFVLEGLDFVLVGGNDYDFGQAALRMHGGVALDLVEHQVNTALQREI